MMPNSLPRGTAWMPSSPPVNLRLQREEIHHLRQRQRDHGEIDALPADGERPDDHAEHGAGRGAGQDRELGREAPDLGGVGADDSSPSRNTARGRTTAGRHSRSAD